MNLLKQIVPLVFMIALFIFSCGDDDMGTCTDGILNGIETGIDCGGACLPCPTCSDGVQNGTETGIDCGGFDCFACPEPSCTDGIQNGNEEGIDCGGDCPQCYAVGDVGPGGLRVFYDKGNYNDGWRYLQLGPALSNFVPWGCSNVYSGASSFEVGDGLENTNLILDSFFEYQCNSEPEAAYFSYWAYVPNGPSDFFLPSVDELKILFEAGPSLRPSSGRFWSSTEVDAIDAYVVDFGAANVDDSAYTYFKVPTNGSQGSAIALAIRRF